MVNNRERRRERRRRERERFPAWPAPICLQQLHKASHAEREPPGRGHLGGRKFLKYPDAIKKKGGRKRGRKRGSGTACEELALSSFSLSPER